MIHIPISKLALVMMLCFLLTTGCGVFQQKKPHYNSCGPDTIFHAFRWHGVESSRIKISKEILEDHKAYSLLRDVLSAIILVHPKNKFGKYHWLFYPTQSDSPSSFFGTKAGTLVDKVYILERVTS